MELDVLRVDSVNLSLSERPSHQLVTEGARTFLSSTVDPLAMYGSATCAWTTFSFDLRSVICLVNRQWGLLQSRFDVVTVPFYKRLLFGSITQCTASYTEMNTWIPIRSEWGICVHYASVSTAEACALYSVVSLLLFPPQKVVIESASISTGEVLLVSMRK